MQTLKINNIYHNKKISEVLFKHFSGLTLDTFHKTLRKKDIKVNGSRITSNILVYENDIIQIYVIDELLYKQFVPDIVFEDDNILVINKPNCIEVLGDKSLTSNLKQYFFDTLSKEFFLEPCHRLDRNTCGLVLFAKNKNVLDALNDKFKNGEIEKHYIAKVHGTFDKPSQTLESYLFKDNKKALSYISDTPKKGYVKILTSYSVLKANKNDNYSILDVTLHTGKTHQIRAHLAHINHPILGDGKYRQ